MRRFDKNWKRKGYLTVESSVIFSLSVIVIGWMLSLVFSYLAEMLVYAGGLRNRTDWKF